MDSQRKYAVQGQKDSEAERLAVMVGHMAENKAYLHARERAGGDPDGRLLEEHRARFAWYREQWRAQPRDAVARKLTGEAFRATGAPPLCIDVETAAVCDLACPFCYRQLIATPDKIMDPELCLRIIDQAAELGVPSMKFNWRGEPLLNPRLPDFIAHAKRRGILETIINTNATKLDDAMARRLIDAGLDLMIYSFDGGTRESYERMRPGRFDDNRFDDVYRNIRHFAEIRQAAGARFPRTKIQMILTRETFGEQASFLELFEDCVDDVSVKQYSERGAGIAELDDATRERLRQGLADRNLPADTPFLRDKDGALHVATGRLPCEQPFQRLLVTYDGKVGMCCYDWGAQHPVGFVADTSFADPEAEYRQVMDRVARGAKGFEAMRGLHAPMRYNDPEAVVQTLREIWHGTEIDQVRSAHVEGRAGEVTVCRSCPFKETYRWEPL